MEVNLLFCLLPPLVVSSGSSANNETEGELLIVVEFVVCEKDKSFIAWCVALLPDELSPS